MAIIASTASPLSALSTLGGTPSNDDDESVTIDIAAEDDNEETEDDPVEPKPRTASIKKNLIDQIDNINLARDIDEQKLNTLGALVVSEYKIDENSRADWKDKAEQAMSFATQEAQEKQYPWPKACLSLDTDILTRDGWRPIADVKVGDYVMSRAEDGSAEYYPVKQTFRYQATEVVHFQGKSIDILATPNHRMLVEDKDGIPSFIDAGQFVSSSKRTPSAVRLASLYIPLTSTWSGACPAFIYGVPAQAYVRFLGWFISEGSALYGRNIHRNKAGENIDYGVSGSSFSIAQDKAANPEKYEIIRADIEACGFTYSEYPNCFIVHARSMPDMMKAELRSLGRAGDKHIPAHVMALNTGLLTSLLDTMIAGDGHIRRRPHYSVGAESRSYFTISRVLAGQVQEVCQKLGMRGTVAICAARAGGVINGRQITGASEGYGVSIASKARIQIMKLARKLIPYTEDVACVEVEPHHTIYVRRNGKAIWIGNSNIIFPLITQSALQFAARTYPALIQNRNVVKGVVWGTDKGTPVTEDGKPDGPPKVGPNGQPIWLSAPGEKRKRADRIGEHMSWQLLDEMPEWEPQTDQLLHQIPIVGGAVRKTYRDPAQGRNFSLFVPLLNLVWNYHAPSFEAAPRHTEILTLYPHEILEFERTEEDERGDGMFLHVEYGPGGDGEDGQGDEGDADAPHTFLEQHRRYDLDGDGYAEPYTVTVHKRSSKVVRIVARYDADGIHVTKGGNAQIKRVAPVDHYTLIPFLPSVDGGSYPMGFGHLLRPLNEAINTTLNQMFDAGHLQNAGGGFIGDGISMASGPVNFQVGKYVRVTTKGQAIRDSVFPLPFQGPSPVLFQLLGVLMSAGKEVASIQDILAGDATIANAPPTTILALIEQGMKMYTAIHKRVYRALKSEFAKLYRLNRLYLTDNQRYRVGDEWREVTPDDYRLGGGVEPIADPTMITDMQKLTRAQIGMTFNGDPLINQMEIRRRLLDAANFDRIDEILMPPPPPDQVGEQIKQSLIQIELAQKGAELGRTRAAELKDQTQAMLNMANTRAVADQGQIQWIDNQLDLMRLHIEAVNASTRAASVDAQIHRTNLDHRSRHADRQANLAIADMGRQTDQTEQPAETP